ncbi:hypothetical protein THASP1DRAFT_33708, partial [Thamnocephalis sphaerospora]
MNGFVRAISLAKAVRPKQRGVQIHIENRHSEAVLLEPQLYRQGGVIAEPLRNVLSVDATVSARMTVRSREPDRCAIIAYRIVSREAFVRIKCDADASLDGLPTIWLVVAWELSPVRGHRFALELVEAPPADGLLGALPSQSQLDSRTIVVLLDYLRQGEVPRTPPAFDGEDDVGGMYLPGQALQRHCTLEDGVPFTACATLKDASEAVLHVTLSSKHVDASSGLTSPTLPLEKLFPYSPPLTPSSQSSSSRPKSAASLKGKMTLGEALRHAMPRPDVPTLVDSSAVGRAHKARTAAPKALATAPARYDHQQQQQQQQQHQHASEIFQRRPENKPAFSADSVPRLAQPEPMPRRLTDAPQPVGLRAQTTHRDERVSAAPSKADRMSSRTDISAASSRASASGAKKGRRRELSLTLVNQHPSLSLVGMRAMHPRAVCEPPFKDALAPAVSTVTHVTPDRGARNRGAIFYRILNTSPTELRSAVDATSSAHAYLAIAWDVPAKEPPHMFADILHVEPSLSGRGDFQESQLFDVLSEELRRGSVGRRVRKGYLALGQTRVGCLLRVRTLGKVPFSVEVMFGALS